MSAIPPRVTPVGRPNRMKRMIEAGEVPLGVLLSAPSPRVVEMCALAGADFIIADTEHHPFDWDSLENIVRACEATGITPGVRTMGLDGPTICRLLDIGYQYLTVPNVETGAQAQALVDAAFYPPMGKRGVDLTRFSGFGLGMSARDYLPIANDEVLIGLSIESVTGLENVEAIAALPAIRMMGVGPTDLSTSMGLAGDHHHPDVLAAAEKIHAIGLKHGKIFGGTPLSQDEIPALIEGGAQYISMSLSRIIGAQIRGLAGAIRAATG
ncbi:MAG: aldolase/citrate lyase family protein [Paracoccus sp. (in: a-proteobacteria)]|uniref:HpcH/HpaI aldolase family protein n=1 Tax=Paracoccus sp. TaxID=267 RepID=UPI0039E5910F